MAGRSCRRRTRSWSRRTAQPARAASPSWSRATRRRWSAACLPGSRRPPVGCRWTSCSWTTARAMRRPPSGASTARASTRWSARADSAPPCAPASRSPATRATPPPCTSTATASTTRRTSSVSSSRWHADARTTCSARASSADARACPGTERSRTARRARCWELCSARSRAMPRPAAAGSRPARSPPRTSGTTTTTRRCSRSHCGAPASTRSKFRSATGVARPDGRLCATPSTSPEWRPPSGASGAPRAPRAGPAAARPHPRRPPARTASRHRARTAAADR